MNEKFCCKQQNLPLYNYLKYVGADSISAHNNEFYRAEIDSAPTDD